MDTGGAETDYPSNPDIVNHFINDLLKFRGDILFLITSAKRVADSNAVITSIHVDIAMIPRVVILPARVNKDKILRLRASLPELFRLNRIITQLS